MAYNPTYDLRGKPIAQSYSNLMQYDGASQLAYDGLGNQINLSDVSASVESSSYAITSSYANKAGMTIASISASWASMSDSASWAPGSGGGTTLVTASTYQITASRAVSASWAPATGGTTLVTASTYPITSSNAISASWAPSSGGGTTLTTASTYSITSSWSNNSISASWAPSTGGSGTTLTTASTYQITASWANSSINAVSASNVISTSWANTTISASYAVTSTNAVSASNVVSASWANIAISASYAPVTGGTTLTTASTYQITSSWSNNSINAVSASNVISSSWSSRTISASYAVSASWSPGSGGGTTLTTASTYQITASWTNNAISATYAPVVFGAQIVNTSSIIDWGAGTHFYKLISANTTFSFINNADTFHVEVAVANSASFGVFWPTGSGTVPVRWNITPIPSQSLGSGSTDIYSFMQINGRIYANVVQGF